MALAITEAAGGRARTARAERPGEDEFTAIVERYERPIYTFLRRVTGNPDDAVDLTQETFLRAYRAIGRTGDDLNTNAWLHRIAANAARDLKRRQRRLQWIAWDPAAHARPSSSDDHEPEAAVLAGEVRHAIRGALGALAPRQRRALLLRADAELSYGEIARALGVSVSATKGILYRARVELRRHYKQQGRTGPDGPVAPGHARTAEGPEDDRA